MVIAVTLSLLFGPQLASAPPAASPQHVGPVQKVERLGRGTLVTLWLDTAPFPAETGPYTDSTVLVWIPDHYRGLRGPDVDILLHFHGHSSTAARALKLTRVAQQLEASGRFAVLVLPQLALEARDSSAGKLEERGGVRRMLHAVMGALGRKRVRRALRSHGPLPRRARPGRVMVSAHSGGFQGASLAVRHGQVNVVEVYLFDALYGYNHRFIRWLRREPTHRLVTIHRGTGTVAKWTEKLKKSLTKRKLGYVEETIEGTLSSSALSAGRTIISQTDIPHARVVFESNALRDCLRGSPLGGLPDNFRRNKTAPRVINISID
ncbi:MAG: hypothetical protein ACI9OJ_002055 [Myxococcota bacterium]|jgi:hypothetical protein